MNRDRLQLGFTLVELLISMVMALIILGGLYSNFVAQSRVSAAQSTVVSSAQDLRLAAQIMDRVLKEAQAVTVTSSPLTITYTPLDTPDTSAACGTGFRETVGHFQYGNATNRTGTPRDAIWWKIPGACTYQQLVDGLLSDSGTPAGFEAQQIGGILQVSLRGSYLDADRQSKDWAMTFQVYPRN